MTTMKFFNSWRLLLYLALGWHALGGHAQPQPQPPTPAPSQAQPPRHTYAPGSPTYYRNTHGEKERVEVYRRDPNIWVYTPEVAKRAGMPLEWASDELKGVAAAAFRLERDGAEEDCGWGGNRNACKPVYQCVLELYFDRQEHKLPWDPKRMVADFDWQTISTATHLLPNFGWVAEANGDVARGSRSSPNFPSLGARQPFTDPETGAELFWAGVGGEGGMRVLAYDREIHGRYALVRLLDSCGRPAWKYPSAQTLQLQSRDKHFKTIKVFQDVSLPAPWVKRVRELSEQDWNRDNEFFKKTWDNINEGDKK